MQIHASSSLPAHCAGKMLTTDDPRKGLASAVCFVVSALNALHTTAGYASSFIALTLALWPKSACAQAERATLKAHTDQVLALAFSRDGSILASGSVDKTIRLWDVLSGKELACLKGHKDAVWGLAFDYDAKVLFSGSADGTVRMWDTRASRQLMSIDKGDTVKSLTYSAAGNRLAVVCGERHGHLECFRIVPKADHFDIATEVGASWSDRRSRTPICVAIDARGSCLAIGGTDLRIMDAATGSEKARLIGHNNTIGSLAFSPDNRVLASGSGDQSIKLWEMATFKERITLNGHGGVVEAIAFSDDGRTLASGATDSTIKLWDTLAGKELTTINCNMGHVNALAFAKGGSLLACGGENGCVKLLAIKSLKRENIENKGKGIKEDAARSNDHSV